MYLQCEKETALHIILCFNNLIILDCSRFWLCGPDGETCLNECAHCGGPTNPVLCEDQWALTFDPSIQYPDGPVCNWPIELDCGETVSCDVAKPEFECCENQDCCACPGHCYCAFNSDESASQCVIETPCDCQSNTDCSGFDGVCNVPPPHDESSCSYCEDHECKPGKYFAFPPFFGYLKKNSYRVIFMEDHIP